MKYEIITIVSDIMEANCYIIKTNDTTVLIDPCVPVNTLKRYNIDKIDAILITHGHVDHIIYLEEIINIFNPTLFLTKKNLEFINDDNLNLSNYFIKPLKLKGKITKYNLIEDNSKIELKDLQIKCISTPGHTNDSMCFILDGNMFTGDTLFDRSVGRSDFPTGNSLELRQSLKKIINLNVDYTIYPGHNDSSTISEQKKINYYLQF